MGREPKVMVDHVRASERRRVAALLERDRAYRAEERLREIARAQVEQGEFTNIADAAIGPTPEQIEQAERDGAGYRSFTPKLPNGTVRTVKGYRRRDVPQAYKMMLAGVIDHEGMATCIWYRNLHEQTGLTGRIGSIDYGREVFASPATKAMFTDWQVEAQDAFRFVRRSIRSRHLALLDLMVLDDVPIHRAVRAARAFHRRAKIAFGEAVKQLLDARGALGAG